MAGARWSDQSASVDGMCDANRVKVGFEFQRKISHLSERACALRVRGCVFVCSSFFKSGSKSTVGSMNKSYMVERLIYLFSQVLQDMF